MNLIDIPVEAWIPIRTTIWKERLEGCEGAIARFSAAAPALVETIGNGLSRAETSIGVKPPKKILKALAASSILVHSRQVDFLRVSATHTLDRDKFNEENPEHPLDGDIADAIASLYLSEAIETLLVLSEFQTQDE